METIQIFKKLVKTAEVDFELKIEESREINLVEVELESVECIGLTAENDEYLIDECYKWDVDKKPTAYIYDKEFQEVIEFTEKELKQVDAHLEELIEEKNKELRAEFDEADQTILNHEEPSEYAWIAGQ